MKGISLIEQHVEKFVVAILGILLLAVLAMQFLTAPNRVSMGGEEVDPSEIEGRLRAKADAINGRLGGGGTDAPLVEGEDSNLYDVLNSDDSPNPDDDLMVDSLRTEIERSLATLTPREGDVIRLYFGLNGQHPLTLEEIGEKFDLTRERVRQIKEKAIRRLKHTSRSKILKTYLG